MATLPIEFLVRMKTGELLHLCGVIEFTSVKSEQISGDPPNLPEIVYGEDLTKKLHKVIYPDKETLVGKVEEFIGREIHRTVRSFIKFLGAF